MHREQLEQEAAALRAAGALPGPGFRLEISRNRDRLYYRQRFTENGKRRAKSISQVEYEQLQRQIADGKRLLEIERQLAQLPDEPEPVATPSVKSPHSVRRPLAWPYMGRRAR